MRASFVEHLYKVDSTPKPVVWGKGLERESGPLPRMPDEASAHASPNFSGNEPSDTESKDSVITAQGEFSSCCCIRGLVQEFADCWPVVSLFCTCPAALPPTDERQAQRQQRLEAIAPRGHAMADDEILFHLEHILEFYRRIPRSSQQVVRQFVHIPPVTVAHWLAGNHFEMLKWRDEIQYQETACHVIFVACIDQHWVPFWLAPQDAMIHCHTFHHQRVDTNHIDSALQLLAVDLGFNACVIHRVPNPVHDSGLCGPMALSFLAHVILRTPLPMDDQQLRDRSWSMKQKFADTIQFRPPTTPLLWGWFGDRESRPLPRMPEEFSTDPEVTGNQKLFFPLQLPVGVGKPRHGLAMGLDEMQFHISQLAQNCPSPVQTRVFHQGNQEVLDAVCTMNVYPQTMMCAAVLENHHWYPLTAMPQGSQILVITEKSHVSARLFQHPRLIVIETLPVEADLCGAFTLFSLAMAMGFWPRTFCMSEVHALLRQSFVETDVGCNSWGFGPSGQLLKALGEELQKHGIPPGVVESRANDAIKVLGSEQVAAALGHRQPWRQLKILGNQAKFHFVLPSELDEAIMLNKGKSIGSKGKGKSKGKLAGNPVVDLDPHKLRILEGTFKAQSQPVSQILPTQIGPVSSGVVLMSLQEAEPYLRAGQRVSQEPLAIAVLRKPGVDIGTVLPHADVTIPCRCTLDQEPVLVDTVLVQIGNGLIEKMAGTSVVHIDSLEVVTLKIMVYRDELQGDWDEFCQSPIRCLVNVLPKLKKCTQSPCDCAGWHNAENPGHPRSYSRCLAKTIPPHGIQTEPACQSRNLLSVPEDPPMPA